VCSCRSTRCFCSFLFSLLFCQNHAIRDSFITKLGKDFYGIGHSCEYTQTSFYAGPHLSQDYLPLVLKFSLFSLPYNSFHHQSGASQPRWTSQRTAFPMKASLFKHCSRRPLSRGNILFHFSSTNTQTPQDGKGYQLGKCTDLNSNR